MNAQALLAAVLLAAVAAAGTARAENEDPETGKYCYRSDLAAFYPIHNEYAGSIKDWSGFSDSSPLDLVAAATTFSRGGTAVSFATPGSYARSWYPATELLTVLRSARQFTIEFWVSTDGDAAYQAPGRIVTLSGGTSCGSNVNFIAAQGANRAVDSWTRTSRTGSSCSDLFLRASERYPDSRSAVTHVVYTFGGGRTRVYYNGQLAGNKRHRGNLNPWDRGFYLHLGNEATLNRAWGGEIHKLAVWCRKLSNSEVGRLYDLGHEVNHATDECEPVSATLPDGACRYNYDDPEDIGYRVTYLGAELDGNYTTWCWQVDVDASAPHALSHWAVGVCDQYWPDYSRHQPPSCGLEMGTDPTTGLTGVKFDCEQAKGTSRVYTITVSGRYTDSDAPDIVSSFKGGQKCAEEAGTGPRCGQTPTPLPGDDDDDDDDDDDGARECSSDLTPSHTITYGGVSYSTVDGYRTVSTFEYTISGPDITSWRFHICDLLVPYFREATGADSSIEEGNWLSFSAGAGTYTMSFNGRFSEWPACVAYVYAGANCGELVTTAPLCMPPEPDTVPPTACPDQYPAPGALGYDVTYIGAEYADNTTTWCWRVDVAGGWPSTLNHWVAGVCDQYWSELVTHKPAACGLELGTDPATGLAGAKFDCEQDAGTSRVYSLTVRGRYTDDAAPGFPVSFRGELGCADDTRPGPPCGQTPEVPGPDPDPEDCSEDLSPGHTISYGGMTQTTVEGYKTVSTFEYTVAGPGVVRWSFHLCDLLVTYFREATGSAYAVEGDNFLAFEGGAGTYTVSFNGNFTEWPACVAYIFAGAKCGERVTTAPLCAEPTPDVPPGDDDDDDDDDGDNDGDNDGDSGGPCVTTDPGETGYSVELVDAEYDGGVTTFSWQVSTTAGRGFKDLSHWVIEVCPALVPYYRTASPAAEGPASDPTTGLYGIKWDGGQIKGTTFTYTVSFNGKFRANGFDSLWYSTKGGRQCAFAHVDGPACGPPEEPPVEPPVRDNRTEPYCYDDDLVLFYPMDDAGGATVHDRATMNAGRSPPLDLTINDESKVQWLSTIQGLSFVSADAVAVSGDASWLADQLTASNAFTAELWITTSRDAVGDAEPARIFSFSGDTRCPEGQNLMVGQSGDWDQQDLSFRLHTTDTSSCNSARYTHAFEPGELRGYHVVVSWNGALQRVFVNGNKVRETEPGGELAGAWNRDHLLRLGNEDGLGRDWNGRVHRVAVWRRALDTAEVAKLFTLGPNAGATCNATEPPVEPPIDCDCSVANFSGVMLPDDGLEFACAEECQCLVRHHGYCGALPEGGAFEATDTSRASRALSSSCSRYPSNHAMWLPNWAASTGDCYPSGISEGATRKWIFDPEGSGEWRVNPDDGTVRLTGVLRQPRWNRFGDHYRVAVNVTWGGRTRTPLSGSPKKELYDEWYDTIDLSQWWYYPDMLEARIDGLGPLEGQSLTLTRMGPALQEGEGANGKDLNYGASAWFNWQANAPTVDLAPGSCCFADGTGRGDFNLDVLPSCEVATVGTCEEPPIEPSCGRCLVPEDCAGTFPAGGAHTDVRCEDGQCVSYTDGYCGDAGAPAGYTLTDGAAASEATNHAFWCRDCFESCGGLRHNRHWRFDPPGSGRWTEDREAGTARLEGRMVNKGLLPEVVSMLVNVSFSGRVDPPGLPDGSPKNPRGSDFSGWHYYTGMSGELRGLEGRLAGMNVPISREGPAMQVGLGANVKNDNYGGASWVKMLDNQELDAGCKFVGALSGAAADFNIDLEPRCEWRPDCEPPIVDECQPCAGNDAACADHFPDSVPGQFKCNDAGFCEARVETPCEELGDLPPGYVARPGYLVTDGRSPGAGSEKTLICQSCFSCSDIGTRWRLSLGDADPAPSYEEGGANARLTATLHNVKSPEYRLRAEVIFSGLVRADETPPSGSPYHGASYPADPSDWYFYTELTGRLFATDGPLAGLDVPFRRFGPSFQVGVGANLADPEALGASFWAEVLDDAPWGQPALSEPCQFQGPVVTGMLDMLVELEPVCELHQDCEPPIVPPECVDECDHASDCIGSFPAELEDKGKVSCTGNWRAPGECLLELHEQCPGLPPDSYNETERICALPPCGWNWFCPDCFDSCGGYALSPAWAFPCGECAFWEEDEEAETAVLSGELVNAALHHPYRVHFEVTLTGRVDAGEAPPAGSPRTSAYFTPADTSGWRYYEHVHGRIWADEGPLAGLDLRFERDGAAFQLGVGATLVHEVLGGHADIKFTSVQQPAPGGSACQFVDPGEVDSHIVVDLEAWCDITPVCVDEPAITCPPSLDTFGDAYEITERTVGTAFTVSSSVRDASGRELALESHGATLDEAQLDYPSPASGQLLAEYRSFRLEWTPALSRATFTETRLCEGGGGDEASVSAPVALATGANFNAVYVRARNGCPRNPANVLRVHNLHLEVDGVPVNPEHLTVRWVGVNSTAGGDDVLELLHTGLSRSTPWVLTGETTTFRKLLACDDGETGLELVVAEARPRPCEPEKQCPVVVDFKRRSDGTHFVLGDRLNEGEPLAGWAGLRVHTEFPDADLEPNALEPTIFDTEAPVAGELDLGTPHEDFGGPGRGHAGRKGEPGQNRLPLGNAVMITGNRNPASPSNFGAPGGVIVFEWDTPVTFISLALLDTDARSTRVVAFDAEHRQVFAHDVRSFGENGYVDVFAGVVNVRRVEVRLCDEGAVTHIEFCPEASEPPVVVPCDGDFDKGSLVTGGTFRLHNHPDGGVKPPLYGLRLDGLHTGTGSEVFTFDFDYPGADMRMRWAPESEGGYLHIFGVAYGGHDCGSAWGEGWPHRFSVSFKYYDATLVDGGTRLVAGDDSRDGGSVTDLTVYPPREFELVPSRHMDCLFQLACGHRGAPGFSGWGFVDHSDRPHVWASAWVFTVGECVSE